jgi:hypothetical protein
MLHQVPVDHSCALPVLKPRLLAESEAGILKLRGHWAPARDTACGQAFGLFSTALATVPFARKTFKRILCLGPL